MQNHTVQPTILRKTLEVNPTRHVMMELMKERLARLLVSVWMNQHSSRDAVTEWICLALSMDEDDAGLHDDDNPSLLKEADATADEAIKDEWPEGRNITVP